jgi:hypothetical protein
MVMTLLADNAECMMGLAKALSAADYGWGSPMGFLDCAARRRCTILSQP